MALKASTRTNVTDIYRAAKTLIVTEKADFTGATITNLGTVSAAAFTAATITTATINGGTVNGTVIGGTTAAAGTFTTLNATGGGALTGTWSNLGTVTTVDINGGTIDGSVIGGASAAAGNFTTITASSTVRVNYGGTTVGNEFLHVNGGASNNAYGGITTTNSVPVAQFWNQADSGTRKLVSFFNSTGGAIVGEITGDGTNATYGTTSDRRLKTDIADLDASSAITAVRGMRARTFTMGGRTRTGFIADELQAAFPDAVVGAADATDEQGNPVYQMVDYGKATPVLARALNNLLDRVEALEGA